MCLKAQTVGRCTLPTRLCNAESLGRRWQASPADRWHSLPLSPAAITKLQAIHETTLEPMIFEKTSMHIKKKKKKITLKGVLSY